LSSDSMNSRTFLFIIFLCVLQVTFLDFFRIFGIKPDLILIGVIFLSLRLELRQALVLAICAGALKDIFGPHQIAVNTPLLCLWTYLVIRLSRDLSFDHPLIRAALIFFVCLTNEIVSGIIFFFLGSYTPIGAFLRVWFLESLYTAAVSPLVFKAVRSWVLERERY